MSDNNLKFYINGGWIDPVVPKKLDVINPATEAPCGAISLGSGADIDKAVSAARDAFDDFSRTSKQERLDLLNKIVDVYRSRLDDLGHAISDEMGAPLDFAKKVQAPSGLAHIKTAVRVLSEYEFEEINGSTLMRKEPIGVVGMITPWNWPQNQIACKVAPALAAGCTMVLKPSEIAPLDAIIFSEILHEAGVPAGVFNLVNGDGPTVGEAMSGHPGIDMMSFTGSTRGGIAVAKGSADSVKRVTQELGGKSANILLDDVDIAKTVKGGVLGCVGNAGQSCNAPSRMLVPIDKMSEAIAAAKAASAKISVGDPRDGGTTMGPLASRMQFDKVNRLIEKGIEEGAELVTGGLGRPDGLDRGYYVRPTVFANVTNDMAIAQEEIFGPVLSIIGYAGEDEAVAIANDTPYGLSGYVSSADPERAANVARRLRTGNVHINGAMPDLSASFGGYKQSGNGREWGVHGFEEFLEVKAIFGAVAA